MNKGVTDALVLTIRELRNFNCQSRTKQWGRPMGCIIYSPHWLRTFIFVGREDELYIYINVGLSALLVSTDRGNAKAYESWNGQQTGSTFSFFVYPKT